MRNKVWSWATFLVLLVSSAVPLMASPLPTFPTNWTPGQEVQGESVFSGPAGSVRVDWTVKYLGTNVTLPNLGTFPELWGYYYQLENQSGASLLAFTIPLPGPQFVAFGFFSGISLDSAFSGLASESVSAHVLAGESEPSPGTIQDPAYALYEVPNPPLSPYVGWVFGLPQGLPNNRQSSVLYGYATKPPKYKTASAYGANTLWTGSVPVPSPEPGVAVLLLLGMMGIGAFAHQRQRKSVR